MKDPEKGNKKDEKIIKDENKLNDRTKKKDNPKAEPKVREEQSDEPEPRRLYRSRKDKVIAGVCGGIAEYFSIDPVWVRLACVLLIFADGLGLLFYIIAWILVPKNPNQDSGKDTYVEKKVNKAMLKVKSKDPERKRVSVLGIIFIFVGGVILLKRYMPHISFLYVWAAGFVIFGVYLLFRRSE